MAKRTITEMFEILDGEFISGQVDVLVTVSQGKGADKVVFCQDMPHTLDYTGVKLVDLVDSAAANDVVSLQNQVWRTLGKGVTAERDKVTMMKEFYARERTRTAPDPIKAILNKEMDADALADLIAQLQAKAAKQG